MAVTITSRTRYDANTWRIDWSSDLGGTPTFYIYRNGILVEQTTRTWAQIYVEGGASIDIEVLDTTAAPQAGYPDRAELIWEHVTDALKYKVEEYVDSIWTERQTLLATGATYYFWESRRLEDATTHQFRVTALGAGDVAGTTHTFIIEMVRRPNLLGVNYTYDDVLGKITVAAT